ncbi:MAG: DUF5687 family protein [Bacteroidota bacterium]
MPPGSLRLLIRTQALLARRDLSATLRDSAGLSSLIAKALFGVVALLLAISTGVSWPELVAMQAFTSGGGLFLLICLTVAFADWVIRPTRGQRLTRYLPWPFSRAMLSRYAQAMVPFNALTALPYVALAALVARYTVDPALSITAAQATGGVLLVLAVQYVGSVVQLLAAPDFRIGVLAYGGLMAALALDLLFDGLVAQFIRGLFAEAGWSWLHTGVLMASVGGLAFGSVLLAQRRLHMGGSRSTKALLAGALDAPTFVRQTQLRLLLRSRLFRMQLLALTGFLILQISPILEKGQAAPLVFVLSMASLVYGGSAFPFNSVGFDRWAALPVSIHRLLAQIVHVAHGITLTLGLLIALPIVFFAPQLVVPTVAIALYSLGVSTYLSVFLSLFVSRRTDPNGKLYENRGTPDNLGLAFLVGFLAFIPPVVALLVWRSAEALWPVFLLGAVGLASLAAHRLWIDQIGRVFERRRYRLLVGYRQRR